MRSAMKNAVLKVAAAACFASLTGCVSSQFHASADKPQISSLYDANRACIAGSTTPVTAAKYRAARSDLPSPLMAGIVGGAAGGLVAGLATTPELEVARAEAMQQYNACMAAAGWAKN